MAKYSTGGSSDSGGGSCELCGEATDDLTGISVAGAQLQVCSGCASHNDNARTEKRRSTERNEQDRKRKAAQNAARMADRAGGDSTHWEREGTNYEDDPLPYLVSGYGERATEARQEAGLRREELADELDLPENILLAVEQGRANGADVSGSVIAAIEDRLDVTLAE